MAPPLLLFLLLVTSLAPLDSAPVIFPRGARRQSVLTQKAQQDLPAGRNISYTAHFFAQTLDHFSYRPEGYKLFNQKYLVNAQFWDRGPNHSAPIFVYTGNEGDIAWFASNTGFLADVAPKFHALLVFIEHRFYGDSMPFGNESYKSAETLGYLNSAQALADYSALIRSLKQNLSAEASPVIAFGGSYGGMLAAWFRLKYPHVVLGALASSSPVLQFDDITPWSSFYDGVSQDFKDESLNCFEVIKGSWDELITMSAKKDGLAEISQMFRSCNPIKSVWSARDWLWEAFTYTAMVDYPVAANFMAPLPAYPVKEMCKIIDSFPPGVSKLTKAIAASNLYYNYSGTKTCFKIENGTDEHGLHGWDWQACTEMVMPMIVSNESMFPPSSYNYQEFSDNCFKKYGVRPRPHWITTEYGGKKIWEVLKRFGSNIIFSNGMRDPWSRGGVLRNISDSIVALVTKEGAHHADFRSATREDPQWLVEQRRQEVEIIQKWIDQYRGDQYQAQSK